MRVLVHTGIGSGTWGLGHGVRMLALAKALTAQGADVEFLTQTPALVHFVQPFPCRLYRNVWPEWTIDVLVEDVPCQGPDVWYASFRERSRVVRVDVPTATPETCDLLIAPCAHWDSNAVADLRLAFGARFLYGWDYVLLDEAVTRLPRIPYAKRTDGPVIFCAGGSDPDHDLERMAGWMGAAVTGGAWKAMSPFCGDLHPLPGWMQAVPFAHEWIQAASLLVTIWGTTCYESLWFGTPLLTLARTDMTHNDAICFMAASGAASLHLGRISQLATHILAYAVEGLGAMSARREGMAAVSENLLDGLGAQRAATAILALKD